MALSLCLFNLICFYYSIIRSRNAHCFQGRQAKTCIALTVTLIVRELSVYTAVRTINLSTIAKAPWRDMFHWVANESTHKQCAMQWHVSVRRRPTRSCSHASLKGLKSMTSHALCIRDNILQTPNLHRFRAQPSNGHRVNMLVGRWLGHTLSRKETRYWEVDNQSSAKPIYYILSCHLLCDLSCLYWVALRSTSGCFIGACVGICRGVRTTPVRTTQLAHIYIGPNALQGIAACPHKFSVFAPSRIFGCVL
jgi:hypothetical protein